MKFINDYLEGEEFAEQALIVSVTKNTNKNGKAYLDMQLKDISGTRNAKKWDILPNDENIFVAGNILFLEGKIVSFNNSLQLNINRGDLLSEEEIDINRFVFKAPVPYEKLLKEFNEFRNEVKNEDLNKILNYIFEKHLDRFLTYPAASSIHHDYRHGLLYHTVSMLNHAKHFIEYYGDLDAELLYAGIILHDFGKVIELEGKYSYKYSLEGKLIGHISIISSLVGEARNVLNIKSEKGLLLQHMVLSHHGQLEYGSPVLPLTKEALLLSMIDNLDSKMNIVIKATSETEKGGYTQKLFPLDGRIMYVPNDED